jgi:hypothetical protein
MSSVFPFTDEPSSFSLPVVEHFIPRQYKEDLAQVKTGPKEPSRATSKGFKILKSSFANRH